MAFATARDMVERFGEGEVIALTDRARVGEVDAGLLENALDEASAEVEGYLAQRYALPLAVVPRLLKGLCCDIARYRLSGAEVVETDPVRTRYRDAVRTLEAIGAGKLALGLDPAGQSAQAASGARVIEGRRSFPDGSLEDW